MELLVPAILFCVALLGVAVAIGTAVSAMVDNATREDLDIPLTGRQGD